MVVLAAAAHAVTPEEISDRLAECRQGAVHPLPTFDAGQARQLADGEVVRVVHHATDPDAPSSAVGVAILRGSLEAIWIAAQDPHTNVDPDLIEFTIEEKTADHALWYGHIDLPSPIRDRQWVVESTNNHGLAARTEGRCWEHVWALVPDALDRVRPHLATKADGRVTPAMLDEAVYTPVNHGGWTLAPLGGDRVLVAYQATAVIGGSIPDWLVLQLTMARLESVLRGVETRAHEWAPAHYTAVHPPVPGADGRPIPTFR